MATKRKTKGAYMISAVAEMYEIHPQTLRLYEREGLLLPSRSEGNTRLYTDEDLERLGFILKLARDLGLQEVPRAVLSARRATGSFLVPVQSAEDAFRAPFPGSCYSLLRRHRDATRGLMEA